MPLTEQQRRHLRRLGHALRPIVRIGRQGLTAGVSAELDRALADHELVKVHARAGSREDRDAMLAELARRSAAEFVYRIGNVGLFYRRNSDIPKILLPDS